MPSVPPIEDSILRLFSPKGAHRVQLGVGETILRNGDACDSLSLLLSGTVRVYMLSPSGREITLYRIQPNQCCILTATCIVNGSKFPAYAITETPVEVLMVSSSYVRSSLVSDPAWQSYLFGLVESRLTGVISVVEEITFKRMDIRVASYLLVNSSADNNIIDHTHQQIALELGTVREVVSRALKEFESDGILKLDRGKITLLNRDFLCQLCSADKAFL